MVRSEAFSLRRFGIGVSGAVEKGISSLPRQVDEEIESLIPICAGSSWMSVEMEQENDGDEYKNATATLADSFSSVPSGKMN